MIYVGQSLCENKVLHRHVCIVFLPNPPIAILELPNCLSHEWLTFLKRCYFVAEGPHFCINQKKLSPVPGYTACITIDNRREGLETH